MHELVDFDSGPYNFRHGSYGGSAGPKDGITWDGEPWIIKYPKSTKLLSGASDLSYTTSPLSEYLGSHIYEMLDIPVHETKMGYRNGKVVVGCKDFCAAGTKLLEMRTIKNAFLLETEEQVIDVEAVSKTGDQVSLEAQRLYLTHNPLLQHVPEASKRFWDMVVVDILIDNNDRNNGNWGLLVNESSGTYTLAPVFDNGNAFSNKASDIQLQAYLQANDLEDRLTGSRTIYTHQGKLLSAKKLLRKDFPEMDCALSHIMPKIENAWGEILKFVETLPDEICSPVRREYYEKGLQVRKDKLLGPAWEKAAGRRFTEQIIRLNSTQNQFTL